MLKLVKEKNGLLKKSSFLEFVEESYLLYEYGRSNPQFYFYNESRRLLRKTSKEELRQMLGQEGFQALYMNARACRFEYNPDRKIKAFHDDIESLTIYNTYEAPLWEIEDFYSEGILKKPEGEYPKLYKKFFKHLTDDSKDSEEYILDWLSVALKGKNITYLTLLGDQGIGKGVLSTVMSNMFGSSNFKQVSDRILKSNFNGAIADCKLLNIDEMCLDNTTQVDRLKSFSNSLIEVEKKGHDSEQVKNFANIYISSNRVDAVKLEAGDRRFSLIDLTSERLEDNLSQEEIDALINDAEMSLNFCYWLLNREPVNNMVKPFISEKTEEVLDASLADWQRYFIHTIIPRQIDSTFNTNDIEIPLKDIQEMIVKGCFGMENAPGRNKFKTLSQSYKSLFKVKGVRGHKDSDRNGDYIVIFQEKIEAVKQASELDSIILDSQE